MNRLGKILTLGLERKRAWQLPLIAGLLLLFKEQLKPGVFGRPSRILAGSAY